MVDLKVVNWSSGIMKIPLRWMCKLHLGMNSSMCLVERVSITSVTTFYTWLVEVEVWKMIFQQFIVENDGENIEVANTYFFELLVNQIM